MLLVCMLSSATEKSYAQRPHLYTIVRECGNLCPDVVHKVLRKPPVLVEQGNEWGKQEHDGEEWQSQQEGCGVENEALDRCQCICHPAHAT